jgi:hydroxymethylbilane synthase
MPLLRLGTRASPLALAQTEETRSRLAAVGEQVDIVRISTAGDRDLRADIRGVGAAGVFTKEIERALLDGDIDMAVHSAKDLPTALADGLTLAACLPREDTRDALVSRNGILFDALPQAARIGTGSPRRKAQLLAKRKDLRFVHLRGNVDTRLRKVREGDVDAAVLAMAGLKRLGRAGEITQAIDFMLPAPGQGAIALEIRSGDARAARAAALVCDRNTLIAVSMERRLLAALGGGCLTPVGALACVAGDCSIEACVCNPDGTEIIRDYIRGEIEKSLPLADELAKRLLEKGARKILETPPS